MTYLQAIILGIVQGLTEFIPISSTAQSGVRQPLEPIYTRQHSANDCNDCGHSARHPSGGSHLFRRRHLGDIHIVHTRPLSAGIWPASDVFRDLKASGRCGCRMTRGSAWLVIIGSIPIGVLGLLLKDFIEGPGTKNLWIIATMLIVIALFLGLAEAVSSKRKDIKHLGLTDAIVMGFCQVLALMPGASRSGSTIMGGLFAGEKRETAARFSFLLSIPAVAASGLLELRQALKILTPESFKPLIVATLVAGVIGYASIWFLLAYLKRNSTLVFIIYRLILGSAILILLWRGVISPVINS